MNSTGLDLTCTREQFEACKLSELINTLNIVASQTASTFSELEWPVTVLLSRDTRQYAVDALLSLLQLKNKIHNFIMRVSNLSQHTPINTVEKKHTSSIVSSSDECWSNEPLKKRCLVPIHMTYPNGISISAIHRQLNFSIIFQTSDSRYNVFHKKAACSNYQRSPDCFARDGLLLSLNYTMIYYPKTRRPVPLVWIKTNQASTLSNNKPVCCRINSNYCVKSWRKEYYFSRNTMFLNCIFFHSVRGLEQRLIRDFRIRSASFRNVISFAGFKNKFFSVRHRSTGFTTTNCSFYYTLKKFDKKGLEEENSKIRFPLTFHKLNFDVLNKILSFSRIHGQIGLGHKRSLPIFSVAVLVTKSCKLLTEQIDGSHNWSRGVYTKNFAPTRHGGRNMKYLKHFTWNKAVKTQRYMNNGKMHNSSKFDLVSSHSKETVGNETDLSKNLEMSPCLVDQEKLVLCLSLCLPFFTIHERISKIALLSVGCYELTMIEAPFTEADFCTPLSQRLVLLPVFTRHIAPRIMKSLVVARFSCIEHLAVVGALSKPLRELCLVNVPTTGVEPFLPPINSLDFVSTDIIRAPDLPTFLSPLQPLAAWLYCLGNRCPQLEFLSLEFNLSFPFSFACGLPSRGYLQPVSRFFSSIHSSSFYKSSTCNISESDTCLWHAVAPVHTALLSRLRLLGSENDEQYNFRQALADHSVAFDTWESSETLIFRSLYTLELLGAASVVPLTLLFCARFPALRSLVMSTNPNFSSATLSEFLVHFHEFSRLTFKNQDQTISNEKGYHIKSHIGKHTATGLTSIAIYHGSNVANSTLLEALGKLHGVKFLRLISTSSFGTNVAFKHETIEVLELPCHDNLSWDLHVPQLQRLIFSCGRGVAEDDCTQSCCLASKPFPWGLPNIAGLRTALTLACARSPRLSSVTVECINSGVVLSMSERNVIETFITGGSEQLCTPRT